MTFFIHFDKDSKVSLTQQVVDSIKQSILSGQLKAGQKLPSSRELAATMNLSRNTIANAYDQLISEALIESVPGSGVYVSKIPEAKPSGSAATTTNDQDPDSYKLSRFADSMGDNVQASNSLMSYRLPRRQDLPLDKWHKLVLQLSKQEKNEGPSWCSDALGYLPLRQALTKYLQMSRALACTSDQIVLFSSRRESLDFWFKVLLEPGETLALEKPCHPMLPKLLSANGVQIAYVGTDNDGMLVDELSALKNVRAVYATPSHQVITGGIMPLDRRKALVQWAEQNKAMIIEDDFDCEFVRKREDLLPAIQGIDTAGRVIYLGSASNSLSPLTEQAYGVIPNRLIEITRRAREMFAGCAARMDEKALAEFISSGGFSKHLRELNSKYAKRRERLTAELDGKVDCLSLKDNLGGTSLLIELDSKVTPEKVELAGSKAGLPFLSTLPFGTEQKKQFLVSYGRVPETDAKPAVELFLVYLREAEITDARELAKKIGRLSFG